VGEAVGAAACSISDASIDHAAGSYVPDHVRNPGKYTCYTFDEPLVVGGGIQPSLAANNPSANFAATCSAEDDVADEPCAMDSEAAPRFVPQPRAAVDASAGAEHGAQSRVGTGPLSIAMDDELGDPAASIAAGPVPSAAAAAAPGEFRARSSRPNFRVRNSDWQPSSPVKGGAAYGPADMDLL